MPQVSIYVALIAAGAAVLGAAVAPVSAAYEKARTAVRDRAEHQESVVRTHPLREEHFSEMRSFTILNELCEC